MLLAGSVGSRGPVAILIFVFRGSCFGCWFLFLLPVSLCFKVLAAGGRPSDASEASEASEAREASKTRQDHTGQDEPANSNFIFCFAAGSRVGCGSRFLCFHCFSMVFRCLLVGARGRPVEFCLVCSSPRAGSRGQALRLIFVFFSLLCSALVAFCC